ncbi:unnamed protein product, partial [Prorocentrum cordatum]
MSLATRAARCFCTSDRALKRSCAPWSIELSAPCSGALRRGGESPEHASRGTARRATHRASVHLVEAALQVLRPPQLLWPAQTPPAGVLPRQQAEALLLHSCFRAGRACGAGAPRRARPRAVLSRGKD